MNPLQSNFQHRTYSILFFCLILVSSCHKKEKKINIGMFEITNQDILLKDQVNKIYYPNETRSLGEKQLVEVYRNAMVLIQNGYPINEVVIANEAKRIQRETLIPEQLRQIQNVFAGDTKRYELVYVLPVLVDRVLYFEFFLNSEKVQGKAKKRAESLLNHWQKGEALKTHIVEYDENKERPHWYERVLRDTKTGQIYPHLIDVGERWLLVRHLKDHGKKKRLEIYESPKEDFTSWIDQELLKVPVLRFGY